MTIPYSEALVCVEDGCQTMFWQREYPSGRSPLCGSESVHLAAAEARREGATPEPDDDLFALVERMREAA